MIDVSEVIHDPDFESDITIERTTGGHYEGPDYKADTSIIIVKGVMVTPKNMKEIIQTERGDIVSGYVKIYVDSSTPIYTTRDDTSGTDTENNISDVVITDYGTPHETRYKILNVLDRSKWGMSEAEAQKEGAS